VNDTQRRARANTTIDAALDRVLAHDMAGFAALWAPDGTMSFPFAAPGTTEQVAGRDAVTAHLAGYNDLLLPGEIVEQTRHDTADPDTVVLELAVAGTVAATGRPYTLRYICVITVGDGGITAYRDYWSPAAAAELIGAPGLPEASA
jgi:ketosteroid isomerase-like protein